MAHFQEFYVQGIVGGAVVPLIIGGMAELSGLKWAMMILFVTLGYILSFGLWAKPIINNSVVKNWSELFKIKVQQ
jgi:fucose permease